ncbi:hypothetical protein M0802_008261 [Mischocyttarus mexicanus]|nr:hypothetical protein M0802_008261 [Mischocyttarus mexicanus]
MSRLSGGAHRQIFKYDAQHLAEVASPKAGLRKPVNDLGILQALGSKKLREKLEIAVGSRIEKKKNKTCVWK